MVIIKINNKDLTKEIVGKTTTFPKYTTQILNIANQNAQGTRPKTVGQMSTLIQEFPGKTYSEWIIWYKKRMPEGINNATNKICNMIAQFSKAITQIDKRLVQEWVKDLVLTKTFTGFCFQESILRRVAEIKKESYRLSKPEDESKGIDGYIGRIPVSIKPITYKSKKTLNENINCKIIFYTKLKDGIEIEFDF